MFFFEQANRILSKTGLFAVIRLFFLSFFICCKIYKILMSYDNFC